MPAPLTKLSIRNFKSIKQMDELTLNTGINVLIGANGAGKSNLISFFAMLGAMAKGELQQYSLSNGGPDSLFFNGNYDNDKNLAAELTFMSNVYAFSLKGGVGDSLSLVEEKTAVDGRWQSYLNCGREARLSTWANRAGDMVCRHIQQAISSWRIYHFQYTGSASPLRRASSIHDCNFYYSDGSNLSSFLWGLKKDHPAVFDKIENAVRQILPSFSGFDLAAVKDESQPDNRRVWLYWRQKNSEYRYKPWQFSDGAVRFIALAAALLQPEPPTTVIIDEPELGLHPHALSVFAGLMHEAALSGTQLIIATQNPELLNSLEADNIITVNQVGGESLFERLSSSELEDWLEEYTLGELFSRNIIQAGLTCA
ncbi:MAG: AAA family ATPase [Candidatus Adiutrix sp.]|jgi:predicted ATPase|nr:AAA family ATPase [Candidatus Adiutrix sp.]